MPIPLPFRLIFQLEKTEAKTNSLVTMTGTASSSTPCPIRPFACHSDPERLAARSGEICAVFSRGLC